MTRSLLGRTALLSALLALAAFVVWEGTLSRTAPAAHDSVLAVIALGVVAAVVLGRGRQRSRSGAWLLGGASTVARDLAGRGRRSAAAVASTIVWILLIFAVIGWDLYCFSREVSYLPTLSRLFGDVTRYGWGRSLVFAAWLVLGACLAAGGRARAVPARRTIGRGEEDAA